MEQRHDDIFQDYVYGEALMYHRVKCKITNRKHVQQAASLSVSLLYFSN